MIIAIDASRNRSGGAKRHLIELLKNIGKYLHRDDFVHVWSYQDLLEEIDDYPWLRKHTAKLLEKSLPYQLYWQRYILPKQFKKNQCDIILNTDAGTMCRVSPCITMSRDMLSYEDGEICRYKYGLAWLRLYVLRYVQNQSLKSADGTIFLTRYAADVIQKVTGNLNHFKIVNHGVSEKFRRPVRKFEDKETLEIMYVSNVDLYKHHWNVVQASNYLRQLGVSTRLHLIGSLSGRGQRRLFDTIREYEGSGGSVILYDHVDLDDLPNLLAQADIFVFASSCENMPNTLIEGMASGLPIACSDRGPMPEVLKDAGVYFDPENVQSIVDALLKLCGNSKLRGDYANLAHQRSLGFSWAKCSSETLGFIRHVYSLNQSRD